MGLLNRNTQKKAHERGLEFQNEMRRAKEITEDEKIAEEIAFKRRLMALGRVYKMVESAEAFDMQKRLTEMKYFLEHHWPLDPSLPTVLLSDIQNNLSGSKPNNSLNVIVMHAPLLPQKKYGGANDGDDKLYKDMEYNIAMQDIPLLGDIRFRKDACLKTDMNGGNANLMNIHFLMSQLPTLVISPRYVNGKMQFNGAVWEPQAARPLIRNLFAIDHNPEEALKSEEYRTRQIDLFHSAVSTITGAVRDSYMMLTEGKKPTLHHMLNDAGHSNMKKNVMENQSLLNFVRSEQQGIIEALDENNTPKLLEVYHPKDVAAMKELINDTKI